MPKIYLALVIHAHQPIGNFDNVIEDAYQKSYLPFVKTLANHPQIKMALHFTGSLLSWFKTHHPDYLTLLSDLARNGQIELISGGFYEPILAILPYKDRCEQILKLNNFLETELGYQAKGMWTAERVWESNLVSAINDTGIKYTILDDTHFRMAGLRDNELFDYYVTEEQGKTLKLVPSSMRVRYLVPFAEPEETIIYLRKLWGSTNHDLLVAMGDDTEKFGVWPKTYSLCYKRHWLDRFYKALANETDWLETVKLGDYLESSEPRDRIYLPTASYSEMMEWALPAKVSQEFVELKHMLGNSEPEQKLAEYLQGGYWRNFLMRYPESNLIHKKMLKVSERTHQLYLKYKENEEPISLTQSDNPNILKLKEAYDCVLQGQCNDAFWHGVFGGLYAPHLRSTSLMALIKAERLLDQVEFEGQDNWLNANTVDYDADGLNEIEVQTNVFSTVYDPKDGGFPIIDFKTRNFSLVNSLQRKLEAYHSRVREIAEQEKAEELAELERQANSPNISESVSTHRVESSHKTEPTTTSDDDGVETIHDIVKVKEKGLDRFLVYDKHSRNCFTLYALAEDTTLNDLAKQDLDRKCLISQNAKAKLIQENQKAEVLVNHKISLKGFDSDNNNSIELNQTFNFEANSPTVHSKVSAVELQDFTGNFAVEFTINLLAGDAHDRYIKFADQQHRLNWQGVVAKETEISLVDEYFRVAVKLTSNSTIDWWVYPIFSVSQSEDGFERVYQGSTVLAVFSSSQAKETLELNFTAVGL